MLSGIWECFQISSSLFLCSETKQGPVKQIPWVTTFLLSASSLIVMSFKAMLRVYGEHYRRTTTVTHMSEEFEEDISWLQEWNVLSYGRNVS